MGRLTGRLARAGAWVGVETGDFNLDARQEVRLENECLVAFARPSLGGHLYELDVRRSLVNVLATLQRRPEPYHDTIRAAARGETIDDGRATITEGVVFKQEGLDRALVYDRHPRKALVDHFYGARCTSRRSGDLSRGGARGLRDGRLHGDGRAVEDVMFSSTWNGRGWRMGI